MYKRQVNEGLRTSSFGSSPSQLIYDDTSTTFTTPGRRGTIRTNTFTPVNIPWNLRTSADVTAAPLSGLSAWPSTGPLFLHLGIENNQVDLEAQVWNLYFASLIASGHTGLTRPPPFGPYDLTSIHGPGLLHIRIRNSNEDLIAEYNLDTVIIPGLSLIHI